jgi:hypothetical protein
LEADGKNVRIPEKFFYSPELRPPILPGERWTLALIVAPADVLTMSGTLWLEEI